MVDFLFHQKTIFSFPQKNIIQQHIRMISEGSWDTQDWSNDEKCLCEQKRLLFKSISWTPNFSLKTLVHV